MHSFPWKVGVETELVSSGQTPGVWLRPSSGCSAPVRGRGDQCEDQRNASALVQRHVDVHHSIRAWDF